MEEPIKEQLLEKPSPLWQSHREKIAWFILIFDLIITILFWNSVNATVFQDARTRFSFRAENICAAIQERMMTYEQVLAGGIGLFKASDVVARSEWKIFVETLQIEKRFPGIQGIGFSLKIEPDVKEKHIQQVQAEGFPDYKIKPEGEREIYTSIIYLEPFNIRNRRAFGYDMFSQSVRREAMERARDTGETSISGKVILVQETDEDVQSGFLVYLPLYKQEMPLETIEQRRKALLGYVYSPFRAEDLMHGILGPGAEDIDLEVYDGTEISGSALMYDSDGTPRWKEDTQGSDSKKNPMFRQDKTLNFYGHPWTLLFSSLPGFEKSLDNHQATFVLILGGIFSLLCFLVIHGAFTTRRQAVQYANEMHRKLEENIKELQHHRDHLEDLVAKRTLELEQSRSRLHHADKLSTLGKLVGSVAHEFNNPLFGVIGLVEQLGDTIPHDDRKKIAELAQKECWRMADMVKNLQDFYKPSDESISSIDMNKVLDETLQIIGKEFKQKGINIIRNYSDSDVTFEAVEDQIKQVVINLLKNASEALSGKRGEVILTTEQSGPNVVLSIQDTGVGIAEEHIKSLFEPFFTTKGVKGTGLGLSVSYGIIKKHGGDIKVESELNKGSTFTVILPKEITAK